MSSPEVSEREQKVLNIIETARAKKQKFRDTQITMAHGAGGKATQGLIEGLLVPAFANQTLEAMADAGTVAVLGANVALTTDSFVVNPISFPRETLEPPKDIWRPPAPDAPLELHEPDVVNRPKRVLIAGIGNA